MLELKNVRKVYKTKSGEVAALNGVSLSFPSTGMVFITGKSGCGKTTMLNVIGGLDGVDSGEISVLGKSFSSFTASEYDSYRNTFIGFIFQEYNLLSEFTVEKNIKIAMELQGSSISDEEFDELLETVEIKALKNRKPNELSGGQRQRVAIARALVKQPRIIMADEPTGALDSNTGIQVLEILKKLSKDKLVIIVSHDLEFAEKYADRIIHLVDGNVYEDITFSENEVESNINEREDVIIIKEGADLNDKEKDAVASAIKNKKRFEFIKKLCYREKRETGEVTVAVPDKSVELKKSKMKLRSSIALGVKSLAVKPFRLAVTILLSALAFAVFGLFDTVANFDTGKVMNNVLLNSPTSSVATYGEYVVDQTLDDKYEIKFSQETLDSLAKETGFVTKGIYDFYDNTNGSTQNTYNISEIASSTVKYGRNYYTNSINGFIEFGEDEITNKEFKDFGYKIIEGRYPKANSLEEVAISTYLADSILYYLDGDKLDEKPTNERRDLVGRHLTIKDRTYVVVGLIDCGEIPEKYGALKTSTTSNNDTQALSSDFSAFIGSGAFKCFFVGKGFMSEMNKTTNRARVYYSGNTSWGVTIKGITEIRQAHKYVYSSKDYTLDNALLFSNDYSNQGNAFLKDDEVLIHPQNLSDLLSFEISIIKNGEDKKKAHSLISDFQNVKDFTIEMQRQKMNELVALIGGTEKASKEITLTKTSEVSGKAITKTLKVAGVYFGLESDGANYKYRIMMNDNLLSEYQIFNAQGEYSRLLFSINGHSRGTKILSERMSASQGLVLRWFGNSVLGTIKENEQMIRQGADLFLYVALALAAFSVFMLFNYIATSIVNKRQSIGVLRGLGSGGKDVLYMFMSESIIISVINGILATVFAALGCILVNTYIANVMNISIAFALFGIRQVLVIFAMSVFTGIISSALPIIKISKEKPVDLIRKS